MRFRFYQSVIVSAMNFLNFSIIIAFAIVADVTARAPRRIVHGVDASIDEFPSTVVIQRRSGHHLCGGTLISNKHVLTAAHCFTDGSKPAGNFVISPASAIRVIAGHDNLKNSQELKHYFAHRIDIQPDWEGEIDAGNSEGDIAIVTLSTEITENEVQKIGKLPNSKSKTDSISTVVGWGITTDDNTGQPSNKLQKIGLKVIDYNFCKAHRDKFVPHNVICAEGPKRDVAFCAGDSGGPLYNTNKEVIGVVSYNYDCTGKEENVFTDVYQYKSWIEKVIKN